MNMNLIRAGASAVILFLLALILQNWLKDLVFYKKNNWDFSLPSGAWDIVPGVEGNTSGKPISNFSRVIFAQPLMILGLLLMLLATWFGNIEV